MKRIQLTKQEKSVLRMIAAGQTSCPEEFSRYVFNVSTRSLTQKELIAAVFEEGGNVVDSKLTDYGRMYLADNPSLRNPVDWRLILKVIGALGAIAAFAALFISCSLLAR